MELRILAVGDVCGRPGLDKLTKELRPFVRCEAIDFTVVNGENADVIGLHAAQADEIFDAGADVITLGNHTFGKYDIIPRLDDEERLLRPANYASQAPGHGYTVYDLGGPQILVINLIGRVFMDVGPENPFYEADRILKRTDADIKLVDFHAEATSEKMALAYYLDGRVSAFWGTHTHIQTADERVLKGGTGYITDLGSTGVTDSILGIKPEQSISRFLGNPPQKYQSAQGSAKLEGAVFTVDVLTGMCKGVERVRLE